MWSCGNEKEGEDPGSSRNTGTKGEARMEGRKVPVASRKNRSGSA